ncbi:MAG: bifunctional demethylmenaquinone methyltransferase/2-methoxy-6-polyprenyl-1,4-benzoquinol methylase UbiE [Chloracidobacterium sp.]|nr:bifunctional demethylmenaquinone methyltransferase/2-methoxy-6-polyprenyl-1,4-benzoquinol methylase UbiE [Chloracidobacterium sp.]
MPAELSAKEAEHSREVKAMFSGIAGRYDLLNHVLSLNIDKSWRRRVKRELKDILGNADAVVLDVACGTGDLSVELQRESKATVIGTDFCRPMLAVARTKNGAANLSIDYVEADAMELAFADDTFDAVTIAFGLRNLPNFENGLVELRRVLKPGGRLVILECSHPRLPVFRQAYEFYFSTLLPRIGGLVSGSQSAYRYLPQSVSKFPDQRSLAQLMEKAGFTEVSYQNLTGGIAALHSGAKPI